MYYKMKVKETWTRVVMLHADTEESAHRKAADGYGQSVTFPQRETETELLNIENPGMRDLFEHAANQ